MSRAPGRGPARFPQPILVARLGDGSRVAICVPPASPRVAITVRRFGARSFSAAQLIAQGALPAHIRDEAERVLHTRRNILVSGGTASGNTTLLNVLIALIPDNQRIVAIEDTLELRIDSPNRVRFEARRLQQGALTIRDLVRHALRHRPDHIVVGEVRGAEAADLLQALNTGHGGSLTTVHANNADSALSCLASCANAGRRRSPVGRDLAGRGGRHRPGDPHDAPRRGGDSWKKPQIKDAGAEYAEIWGEAIHTNRHLRVISVGLAIGVLLLIVAVIRIVSVEPPRPIVVRVDEVGRTEAVTYKAMEAQADPLDPTTKYFLNRFIYDFYSRRRATVAQNWSRSLRFLSTQLANASFRADSQNVALLAAGVARGELQVARVILRIQPNPQQPHSATADFDLVRMEMENEVGRERWTLSLQFQFLQQIPTDLIVFNPMGIVITYLQGDRATVTGDQ